MNERFGNLSKSASLPLASRQSRLHTVTYDGNIWERPLTDQETIVLYAFWYCIAQLCELLR